MKNKCQAEEFNTQQVSCKDVALHEDCKCEVFKACRMHTARLVVFAVPSKYLHDSHGICCLVRLVHVSTRLTVTLKVE